MPESIEELDLIPGSGTSYKNFCRPWDQEIIYFLLIDRFHDGFLRKPTHSTEARSTGFGDRDALKGFCGGTLNGIRKNLNYIRDLGCTSLWISPFLHNNPESYHGYAIQDFLQVDPRFGTIADLKALVSSAHEMELRVIFDVVINHSGNNWQYKGGEKSYDKGKRFPFGQWRFENYPLPSEIRKPEYYNLQGTIQNWDLYPETREGDFFSLKKFKLDESEAGREIQDILFRVFAWWIKETDCDGFRLDTMKHINPLQVARFCTRIRNYAASIGKIHFFIFGEHPGGDQELNEYFKEFPESGKILEGPDSALDFPLHYNLPEVISGVSPVKNICKRYESLFNISGRNKKHRTLVTFLDNHDQVGQQEKRRFAASLSDDQVIGGAGIILTLPGIPCIYYGTEQGVSGKGVSDAFIREAMFDFEGISANILNESCRIYKEIAELALIRKQNPEFWLGDLNFEKVKTRGRKSGEIIAYSRILECEHSVVVYNRSENQIKDVTVQLKSCFRERMKLKYLYGGKGHLDLLNQDNKLKITYFKINLLPFQFAILKLAPKLRNF